MCRARSHSMPSSRDEAGAHLQMMTAGYHATPATPGFQHLLSVTYRNRADGTVRARHWLFAKGDVKASEFAKIDRALDEVLVQLGGMVLTLACPQVTRTGAERQALARSVSQHAICAASSDDPRVIELPAKLEQSPTPKLRLVASK
jgi:hypothetical protein